MITYNSSKWNSEFFKTLLKSYKYSSNMRLLTGLIILSAAYATVVTLINIHYLKNAFHMDTVFFSLTGVILSLFLVFRLNSGYKRWWQGREAWGKLINDTRTFALQLDSIIPPENIERRRFFSRHISNFCISLVWHLRDDMESANYILEGGESKEHISTFEHQPNHVASFLYREIEDMHKASEISDFDKMQSKNLIEGFIDVLGICERIKKTPIPFSHSAFIKVFILIYILILPFGLINAFEYLTIPAVMVMAFAMLGIEIISEEIEDPFGTDSNDLPTGVLADTIRNNVFEIFKVELEKTHKETNSVSSYREIVL
ncbi:MAG: bestrophin family ion channel [Reichenbachiella sp.]|uniref:bestrophin family protein n=1 Tax=Reichenbachiella sp. TaxID=2184521 RepID=UPI003264E309